MTVSEQRAIELAKTVGTDYVKVVSKILQETGKVNPIIEAIKAVDNAKLTGEERDFVLVALGRTFTTHFEANPLSMLAQILGEPNAPTGPTRSRSSIS